MARDINSSSAAEQVATILIPEVGAFWVHVGGENLKRLLKPANMIIPNYQRRSAEDEVLLPWGEADFKRLGLSKEKEPAMLMKLEFEDGAPGPENEEGTQGEGEENYAKLMTLFNKGKT